MRLPPDLRNLRLRDFLTPSLAGGFPTAATVLDELIFQRANSILIDTERPLYAAKQRKSTAILLALQAPDRYKKRYNYDHVRRSTKICPSSDLSPSCLQSTTASSLPGRSSSS